MSTPKERQQKLKNLFKVSVREVIKEELATILKEVIGTTINSLNEQTRRTVTTPSVTYRNGAGNSTTRKIEERHILPNADKIIGGDINALMNFVTPTNTDPDFANISEGAVQDLIDNMSK